MERWWSLPGNSNLFHLTSTWRTRSGRHGFYNSAMVTAPVTDEINFLMPSWFADRSIPQSTIAPYAEHPIVVPARILTEGDVAEAGPGEAAIEDELLPQPAWGTRQSPDRNPTSDEVEAHKVLLSGNHAIWLDDGQPDSRA